jgi:hypothetical protein
MYVGSLAGLEAPHETTFSGCGSCLQTYCMKCADKVDPDDAGDIVAHIGCWSAEMARRAEESQRELAGLTRGVDYQTCSMCQTRVQRSIGCNHMTCSKCLAHFCYVCDCEANGNSGHWKPANIYVGEKCMFTGVDTDGATRGQAKRDAQGFL